MKKALLAAAFVLSIQGSALAAELSPETVARVERDKQKAMDEIDKKYGNKKSSELSTDERREMMKEQNAALSKVYDQHGVDPKEYSRYEAKQSLSDRDATKKASAKLEQKEQDDKKKKEAEKNQGPKEIQVQRGFSDKNPVTLEENGNPNGNGDVAVEKGLPPEALDEQDMAGGMSGSSPSRAPSKSKSGGGRRR